MECFPNVVDWFHVSIWVRAGTEIAFGTGRKKADWADQDFNSRLRLRIETVSFVFPSHHQLVHRDVPATASELTVKKRPDRRSLLYQQYLNCIWVNMPHAYRNSCVACLKSRLVFLQCFDSELWTNKMSDSLSCCGGGWGLCVRIKWLWWAIPTNSSQRKESRFPMIHWFCLKLPLKRKR